MLKRKANRGQLTIDFIFTFLYILALIVALLAVKQNFVKNQNEILIRAQEKRIAYQLAEIITSSAALSDGTAEIRFYVPGIRYLNKTQPMPCDITIANNYIEVKIVDKGKEIAERAAIVKPNNITISGNKCTQEMIIRYT